jgi:hypothetical protein
MFFHTFNPNGTINWQGEVLGHPTPRTVRVQLYSWFTGGKTDVLVLPIEETRGWQFYLDTATWYYHSENRPGSRG